MQRTLIRLRRQIERLEVSVIELNLALNSVESHENAIEVLAPKSVKVEANHRMLEALLSALRDRN